MANGFAISPLFTPKTGINLKPAGRGNREDDTANAIWHCNITRINENTAGLDISIN